MDVGVELADDVLALLAHRDHGGRMRAAKDVIRIALIDVAASPAVYSAATF